MTEERLPLNELLQKAGDGDFLRAVAESVLQLLMEADVEGLIGAGRHERAADRLNWRNGYRDRTLDTRLGSLNLKIPKLRAGSYFPPFLEARKTTLSIPRDRAGTFDRKLIAKYQRRFPDFDEKIISMHARGMSVREIRAHLEELYGIDVSPDLISAVTDAVLEEVAEWQNRPLDACFPFVFFDAVRVKIREGIVSHQPFWSVLTLWPASVSIKSIS